MQQLLLTLLLCLCALALAENLNFRSPSTNHPGLEIPRPAAHLTKRSTPTVTPLQFTHGVASGDPYDTSVILWTRAVPSGVDSTKHLYRGAPASARVCVAWEISATEDFMSIADGGETETSGEVDYTVKVEAKRLRPFTTYWYRFRACGASGEVSEVGRTKTIPAEDDEVPGGLRFAVYSCANYAEGYFNAYGNVARKDSVDYVLHLGDYIYELPLPIILKERIPKPYKEAIQLRDYRLRIATYRTDEDLLLNHKLFPWIPVWDDHEVANNGYTGGSTASQIWMYLEWTSWEQRMHNGIRAYFEWMPIRQVQADDSLRIWRTFKFGKLASLIMLDTRYYSRDAGSEDTATITSEHRSILGAPQEQWLYNQLSDSQSRNATWNILGQQIQFSNLNETAIPWSKDAPLYYDGWAGYRANRRRVLEKVVEYGVENLVVLTGDYHTLWTADLTWDGDEGGRGGYEPVGGNGSLGIELAVTSVTSSCGYGALSYDDAHTVAANLVADNAELKWAEGYYRGYFELTITPDNLSAQYFSIPDILTRNSDELKVARWESEAGSNRLKRPFPNPTVGAVQGEIRDWAMPGGRGLRKKR
ncbi:uncharacterized protein H6S33_012196 [Morchella sextelata]|uniref:uncharacterized protein n=1 Tax=Morchella sextelata TaxID=1174677 RepID=UPI001D0591B5|nr:uncharacterized protein H6S33_012196 [Morchella sextelata]KAH0610669.1 hypothetical protein H6S33_012196 [Morchella sextelata]